MRGGEGRGERGEGRGVNNGGKVLRRSTLEGMQPTLRQVPPRVVFLSTHTD